MDYYVHISYNTNMKELTVNDNLNKARKKAHETMRKNGHYVKMAKASAKARNKKKKHERTN